MKQKWLVTLKVDADVSRFLADAKACGCDTPSSPSAAIPMANNELIVHIEGTLESRDQLLQLTDVLKVSPSSEMHLG